MDDRTHEDIFRAVGKLQGTVEGVKEEVHQIRASQLESERRHLEEIHRITQAHLGYGQRISALEKRWHWVVGIATGVALVITVVFSDVAEVVKRWLGISK